MSGKIAPVILMANVALVFFVHFYSLGSNIGIVVDAVLVAASAAAAAALAALGAWEAGGIDCDDG